MKSEYSENRSFMIIDDLAKVKDPIKSIILSFSEPIREASPPTKDVIKRALNIYELGTSYGLSVEVFLVGEGEIELSFSNLDHFIDVLVLRNGTNNLYYEIGIGESFKREETLYAVELHEIKERFNLIADLDQCVSLESCESKFTTGERRDLLHQASETIREAYQSLIGYVSAASADRQHVFI